MKSLVIGIAALVVALGAAAPEETPPPAPPNPLRPEVRWNLPWPDATKPAAGYALIGGVEHSEIYHATADLGVFSHHPNITFSDGVFYAAWSNHVSPDEDGPGQRVLASLSRDGQTWSSAFELFPPLDKNEPKENRGSGKWRILTDNGWVTLGDAVFGIAEASESGKTGWGRLAREIHPDGSMGKVFWLVDNPPAPHEGLPRIPNLSDPAFTKPGLQINRALTGPLQTRTIENLNHTSWTYALDGQNLTEPAVYRRGDGAYVKLWRDRGRSKTKRLYASISTSQGYWSPPLQTNIPNSPSKVAVGTLPDGRNYIIGNLVTSHDNTKRDLRDPIVLALSWDGMNFDWAQAIRSGAPQPRFSDIRAPGFAYPSAVIANDRLWVIYSVDKEDIAVSSVPLSSLK